MPDSFRSDAFGPSLASTAALNARLIECWRASPAVAERAASRAREALAGLGVQHSRSMDARVVLGAVLVDEQAEQALAQVALQLHALVERAVDWTLAEPERLARFFPDHVRMRPWLQKCPGLATWQGYSRYDAILGTDGQLRIIELNTGCPGSFHNAPRYHEVLGEALNRVLGQQTGTEPLPFSPGASVGIGDGLLPALVLAAEARAGLEPSTIAVLNDENELRFELPLMQAALAQAGRRAVLANATDLTFDGGRLRWRGEPVSATFNKFRISTPHSPHHCWRPGFESRYGAFLAALQAGAFASVNNLAAMTITEDKGLLALLHAPEFRAGLGLADQQFIDTHVAWTARLPAAGNAGPEPTLLARQAALVIKPANEGRGFGVVVGRAASTDEWTAACRPDPHLPAVVQDYVEPLQLQVLAATEEGLAPTEYFSTLSLALVDGQYRGCHVRGARGRTVNEAQQGATITVARLPCSR